VCGIAGIASFSEAVNASELEFMRDALSHRGPDGNGLWIDDSQQIGLVHTRLSIIDLSQNASQPMLSPDQSLAISYNGEIYNYLDLKDQYLQKFQYPFKSNGDTEFLIQAFSIFHFKDLLSKLDGMFAIALLNRKTNKLYLARDRFGEKPLYYFWDNKNFIFASEISALSKARGFKKVLCPEAMESFLKYGYMPSDLNIFENTFQVKPGEVVELDLNDRQITKDRYWDPLSEIQTSLSAEKQTLDSSKSIETILEESVKSRLISDVPIGCFLSSGTDSSLIASLASKFSEKKIDTFTIGFKEKEWDESKNARKISAHIGSNHNELIIDSKNILDSVVETINLYDQPFGDSSSIPTNILSGFASKKVKVALSGDGGDELFSGYARYGLTKMISDIPFPIRVLASKTINSFSSLGINKLNLDKLYKLSKILNEKELESIYDEVLANPTKINPTNHVSHRINLKLTPLDIQKKLGSRGYMQLVDIYNYLPNDILVKVDRSSMNHSLETRAPFLNPALFNKCFAGLQDKNKKDFENKAVLKKILEQYIPKELIYTSKKGFSIPIVHWLRGPLKEWGEEMVDKSQNSDLIEINKPGFAIMWQEHIDNKRNWHHQLWSLFVLTQWLDSKTLL